MPYDYDKRKRRYRSPDGSYVTREELRALIDKLTAFVTKRTASIARKFDAGTITAAEFNELMREVLKAGHIVASSVGRGGRQQMEAADWARVARKIKWQYGFLDRLSKKLASGTISKAMTISRAKAYSSAIYISFADSLRVTVDEAIELGGIEKNEILVRLETNSAESCPGCAADEAEGWMELESMRELGERECGDFCKCDLIFSTDDPDFQGDR